MRGIVEQTSNDKGRPLFRAALAWDACFSSGLSVLPLPVQNLGHILPDFVGVVFVLHQLVVHLLDG